MRTSSSHFATTPWLRIFRPATNIVSSVNRSNVTDTIQNDGTHRTLIVIPPTGNRFYRLHKP